MQIFYNFSAISALSYAALAVLTTIIAVRRGAFSLVPVRLALTSVTAVTALWWAPSLVTGVAGPDLDATVRNLVVLFVSVVVTFVVSPTPRQMLSFFLRRRFDFL